MIHFPRGRTCVSSSRVKYIAKHRIASTNLRTTLERICNRAGVQLWERAFQNMRATRETELTQEHPLHVVVAGGNKGGGNRETKEGNKGDILLLGETKRGNKGDILLFETEETKERKQRGHSTFSVGAM